MANWDELRRVARLLESEIESKLISLNKLDVSANGTYNAEQSNATNKRVVFEALSDDIEGLISKLTKSNNDMKDFIENNKSSSETPVLHHTVRRHREILRDYCTEFSRTAAGIKHQIERHIFMEELLKRSSNPELEEPIVISNRTKSSDYLLREHDSINSCDRLLDTQISIAMSVKENIHSQRSGLSGIGKRVQQITRKYPAINSVMQKIRMKKRKDTLILVAVISACLIFLFIYWMH